MTHFRISPRFEFRNSTRSTPMRDLVYNGTAIREREEMISLTDMWKASGAPEVKRPVHWQRYEPGRNFIDFVADNLKREQAQVWVSRRGKGGGTWAHWQIALAYAKFLSPEFHMWCNTVVREHMEGRARFAPQEDQPRLAFEPPPPPPSEAVTKGDLRWQTEWLSRCFKELEEGQHDHLTDLVKQFASIVWHAHNTLGKRIFEPERLAANGVILLPAPTPDTTFITATQVCWRVIPDERLHRAVPSIIGRQLQSHARKHRWPQGETERLSRRDRPMPTYPESRVLEWLAAGGAATIEHENDWQRRSEAVEAGAVPLHQTA